VLLDNGSPWLLQLSADGDSLKPPAVLSQPQLPPFVAASLYDDASATFGGEAAEAGEAARAAAPMVVVRAAGGAALTIPPARSMEKTTPGQSRVSGRSGMGGTMTGGAKREGRKLVSGAS
jgi:hypothetical protein